MLFVFSSLQVQQKSSAIVQKKSYVPTSKGEYIVTKLDDLVNWARRVSGWNRRARWGETVSNALRCRWEMDSSHLRRIKISLEFSTGRLLGFSARG